jgi:hypothetical protein
MKRCTGLMIDCYYRTNAKSSLIKGLQNSKLSDFCTARRRRRRRMRLNLLLPLL